MRFIRRLLSRAAHDVSGAPAVPVPIAGTAPDPSTLELAGRIAFEADRGREALAFYGRAVDGYLLVGDWRKAERICHTMIRMEPRVIRTRYTLAVLAVGRSRVCASRARIADYMKAVAAAHAEHLAVPALLALAGATAHPRIRRVLAAALRDAGRPQLAEQIRKGTAAPAESTSWRRAARAAMTRPGEVDVAALLPEPAG